MASGFFEFLWLSFALLAPMLLLGLFLAGLIHVFTSRQAIVKWLHRDSLKSVAVASAVGVPMPLCSCSVVPVVAEMRRKGASRSSCMAFLITAPETGADSILVTHGFFGPIAAITRPIVSFVTAVVTGAFCMGLMRGGGTEARPGGGQGADTDCRVGCCEQGVHKPLVPGRDDCYISPGHLKAAARHWLGVLTAPARAANGMRRFRWASSAREAVPSPPPVPTMKAICRHVFRYGFVEVADDILFPLLVGIALGGLLYLAVPSDLMANESARWLAYPVMVLVGVPLYICASASTPIAAAMVAKGLSPGAALVFLMTGPATNSGAIAIIVSQFGARFAAIYVGGVVVVSVAFGILIDVLLLAAGWSLAVNLHPTESPTVAAVQVASALALATLMAWRFRAGALRSGYHELVSNLRLHPVPSGNAGCSGCCR